MSTPVKMLGRLLQGLVAAGLPVDGVDVLGNISFLPAATAAQREQGQQIVANFDSTPAAQQVWEDDRKPERKSIRQAAAQAIAENNTFAALANPTNAQNAAQIKRLTQQMDQVIKRLVQID